MFEGSRITKADYLTIYFSNSIENGEINLHLGDSFKISCLNDDVLPNTYPIPEIPPPLAPTPLQAASYRFPAVVHGKILLNLSSGGEIITMFQNYDQFGLYANKSDIPTYLQTLNDSSSNDFEYVYIDENHYYGYSTSHSSISSDEITSQTFLERHYDEDTALLVFQSYEKSYLRGQELLYHLKFELGSSKTTSPLPIVSFQPVFALFCLPILGKIRKSY